MTWNSTFFKFYVLPVPIKTVEYNETVLEKEPNFLLR